MKSKGKIVPSISLGLEKDGFRCNTCLLKIDYNLPPAGDKGCYIINEADMICPVCSSQDKAPTSKPTKEELEKKKAELLERVLKLPEPTEQICQICAQVYTGSRINLCENIECRKWFAAERKANAYKYGPVYSNAPGGVFYTELTTNKDIVEEEQLKTKEAFMAKMIEFGKVLLKGKDD